MSGDRHRRAMQDPERGGYWDSDPRQGRERRRSDDYPHRTVVHSRSRYDDEELPRGGRRTESEREGRFSALMDASGMFSLATWRHFVDTLTGMVGGSRDERESDEFTDTTPKSVKHRRWAICFWVGIALAPLAALILLLGQGVSPLRAAAVLAILSVVLIGLSVTFREDASSVREDLAEEFQREVDAVRADVDTLRRGVQLTVNRELERVRGELEEARTVMHAEATRLPPGGYAKAAAPVERYQPSYAELHTAEYTPPVQMNPREDYYPQPPSYPRAEHRQYQDYDDPYQDAQTVEPIREEYLRRATQNAMAESEPNAISGDVLSPDDYHHYPEAPHRDYPASNRHGGGSGMFSVLPPVDATSWTRGGNSWQQNELSNVHMADYPDYGPDDYQEQPGYGSVGGRHGGGRHSG
ncbi:MAG: hypothetical protein HOQ05_06550 [Corynebacteriales bacterium]|nr:hypothetical protein [Mycobacteriales bacterium]